MKYFGGKNGKKLLLILFLLLVFAIGSSIYFRFPVVEGAVGSSGSTSSSSDSSATGISKPNTITNIKDVLSLPGVGGNSLPSSTNNNWSMVNEIVEPDGTVVQDIVNTDGTVLTITNKQNVVSTGGGSAGNTGTGGAGNSGTGSGPNISTYNRNTF